MVSRINPLVMATGSPAILESRTRLALYDGGQGPAIDLSQAAPPIRPSVSESCRRVCAFATLDRPAQSSKAAVNDALARVTPSIPITPKSVLVALGHIWSAGQPQVPSGT